MYNGFILKGCMYMQGYWGSPLKDNLIWGSDLRFLVFGVAMVVLIPFIIKKKFVAMAITIIMAIVLIFFINKYSWSLPWS
jgi:hypothetical protein